MSLACPAAALDSVIVFDLDDTLYLERDYVESGLGAVGRWAHLQLGTTDLGGRMVARFRAGERGRLFDDALVAAGITPAPDLVTRMVQVYRHHRPSISLADDARRWFDRRPLRAGLALITDGYRDAQKHKIQALDLHGRGIRIAVCTDPLGAGGMEAGAQGVRSCAGLFRAASRGVRLCRG